MTANVVWIEAIIHRPAIRERISRSASRVLSCVNRRVRSPVWPIVLARSTPETESDSSTSAEMSASVPCLVVVSSLRSRPIRRVMRTKIGSSPNAAAARRQSRRIIAAAVATTVVTLETIEVAVVVTTLWTPPMSFAIRDCTSPVRVRVKKASDRRWRCW